MKPIITRGQQFNQRPMDAQVLARISNGDQIAFAQLYARYRAKIYQIGLLYLKTESIVDEVVNDIFVKVWQQRETLPSIRSFEDWLFILSRNHILNRLKAIANERKKALGVQHQHVDSCRSAEDDLIEQEDLDSLERAIETLPGRQRDVYRLAKEEQLSYEQIAIRLDVSPLTVKTHMQRALSHIRTFFGTAKKK